MINPSEAAMKLYREEEFIYGEPDKIVDGDTLYISGEKIRLYGIDAVEKKQSCKSKDG